MRFVCRELLKHRIAILPVLQLWEPPAAPCSPFLLLHTAFSLPLPSTPDSVFPCCCSSLCSSLCATSASAMEEGAEHICPPLHMHLQSDTQSWGPSCSLLLCANSHSCCLFQERKTDLDHAAWAQVLGNFPKISHNGQVLAKSHTFPLSQFSCNK